MRNPALRLCLCALAIAVLAGCATSKPTMPPMSANGPRTPGAFIWYDLNTNDMTTAADFYATLFGWSFKPLDTGQDNVMIISSADRPIGTAILMKKSERQSRWISFMSVDNLSQSVEAAKTGGGDVMLAPTSLPDRGSIAIIRDNQGAVFGLVRTEGGDPAGDVGQPNTWHIAELLTRDLDKAARFYSGVAGYEIIEAEMGGKPRYLIMSSNGVARAGAAALPQIEYTPEWIPYVAVPDLYATTAKAEAEGGRLIVAPDSSVANGNVAIIADPSGALIGLQQVN